MSFRGRLLALLIFLLPALAHAQGTANSQVGSAANVIPVDCSIALTLGGTAQNIITGSPGVHGFMITNIDTTEPVWMSFTGVAAAGAIGSYPLPPATASTFAGAGSYSSQLGFGTGSNVSVVAATTSHKISCTRW